MGPSSIDRQSMMAYYELTEVFQLDYVLTISSHFSRVSETREIWMVNCMKGASSPKVKKLISSFTCLMLCVEVANSVNLFVV